MMDYQNLSDRLGNVSHFKKLPEADLKAIVSAGQVIRYTAGSTIFAEGEPSAGLYVLFEGQVNLSKLGLQGQECILAVIRPVIMFNEVAVLDGGPNPVTALAVQDSILWRVGLAPKSCTESSGFIVILSAYDLIEDARS